MALAIFDLDNTLLGGDSDHAWGEFLVEQGIVNATAYKQANDYYYQAYLNGNLDINAFLQFSLKPLSQHSTEQLNKWHQQFMQEKIEPLMLSKATSLLNDHRSNGDYLLIITATNAFVTSPIAERLGVDHLLATTPEFINGRYTGQVSGTPCFQAGKVKRLHNWLTATNHSLDGSYFYSDSHNDLPLLEEVDNPVAVDPDDTLREVAQSKGWPIISLR
ncbi:HAD family hydrolase [Endozoicomonas sp. SM1973]|uniref:Histidinol-phosphatase n=1 Tax=Spartinivicinus marinus TaxID=2994442 RepID=A0A853I9X6_9GAMM|nr:HAD-IB family hydrolase [Spartinivicinus marinus]NYZ66357.1 HAD family hydrolase [Spartinivicinus marinus]